ncbi:hypothetical protein F4780DRAFT_589700 [Xylariomycetidae sp. FL0641]|nr:hypothetical protein F4780DRAFT_589700 [Xylariomycetidae sp. FL0641]
MDDYLEGSMDGEDVFPCKGCGEILEEGKAFELAGNRWHLNCFRCNTCGTLLDSDANLLLLGDGSLICNNCTYSCSACGDKIEDLAILTGDQAFCATCFRCRNCKRKIENLRYARTSQGIFCMSCHESLMARRRKKSKAAAQAKSREKESSPMVVDKSLPALPPNAVPPSSSTFSNDRLDLESDTPTELSPRPPRSYPQHDSESRSSSRPARSPERPTEHPPRDASLSVSSHYRNNRNSALFSGGDLSAPPSGGDDQFYIPVALDPSPLPSATPKSTSDGLPDSNRKTKDKDYFSISKSASSDRKPESQGSTPHIAFQEKGRQTSSDYETPPAKSLDRKLSKSKRAEKTASMQQPPTNGRSEEFKLQEAPRSKRGGSRAYSESNAAQDSTSSSASFARSDSLQHLQTAEKAATQRSSQDSRYKDEDEVRSPESLGGASFKSISRKELPPSVSRNPNFPTPRSGLRDKPTPKPSDLYMEPRAAPAPPTQNTVQTPGQEQVGSPNEQKASPKLPRWSAGGDFSMDEDMARILGTDENASSIMRRVSNAVRHGRTNSTESSANPPRVGHARSVSETTSPRWPKSPPMDDSVNGATRDITSPMSSTSANDTVLLKRRLKSSEQRVAELERQFNNEKDLEKLARKVEEKRKTVSVLDTQTEIMIRQLEVLAGYVERAKDTQQPVDPRELEESALRDFVQKLEKLKMSMVASLEQLHSERDELVEERDRAVEDRDSARAEFEQLGRFKNNSDPRSPGNGLGIYNHNHEEPIVEAGPTVVKINRPQVKKFNWKKGSKAMAQNIAKGVGRTVVAFQQPERHPHAIQAENIGLPYNMTVAPVESPGGHGLQPPQTAPGLPTPANGQNRQLADGGRQGFFGFKKAQTLPRTMASMNSSTPTIAEAPTVLFGSELAERAEFERRQIPCVVTRCIEEVELRGMDMEGIYRKTGGNSQTKIIQEGFDKNESFDISDPDLDITAVTSVLKQYFRKLPTPLLTFDIYDRVLETNSIPNDADKCTHLQNVFNQLPAQHKDCLEFLMFHLSRVAAREKENLMTPKNLAVVFAPTIMRGTEIEREMTDMHAKNLAVQFIIENSATIFA